MNVLSLFDGFSGGLLALQEAGIKVKNYFASEIDKHCIKVSVANFPDIIRLDDIRKVKVADLPKIDLIIAGSPCQGFSIAGKGLNFADERSKLFFDFVRILNEAKSINPDVKFLLENVSMRRDWLGIISRLVGVYPVEIDSALVRLSKEQGVIGRISEPAQTAFLMMYSPIFHSQKTEGLLLTTSKKVMFQKNIICLKSN